MRDTIGAERRCDFSSPRERGATRILIRELRSSVVRLSTHRRLTKKIARHPTQKRHSVARELFSAINPTLTRRANCSSALRAADFLANFCETGIPVRFPVCLPLGRQRELTLFRVNRVIPKLGAFQFEQQRFHRESSTVTAQAFA